MLFLILWIILGKVTKNHLIVYVHLAVVPDQKSGVDPVGGGGGGGGRSAELWKNPKFARFLF
jgi:hypothetical protein